MGSPWICQTCLSARSRGWRYFIKTRKLSSTTKFIKIAEEVQQAIQERRPVVALESTIYTHGFPHPENLALASRLENLVRSHGGVPATIGILDGIARIGMSPHQLSSLVSSANSPNLRKVSRRDLGFVCGLKGVNGKPLNGGTTIAATMILADIAGIRVFATGGLGGVHRGAELTMDVSADLTELGKTPVAVISSGCKAFLDIPKTLEFLETQGVAVATFADGREGSIDFPAFWTRDSGVKSPVVLRDESEAAQVLHAHLSLGLRSGLHFANPIPAEHEIPLKEMEVAIDQAHKEAHAAGCTGAATTPFILSKIRDLTGSRSVVANTALVEGNVIRGAKVAVALRRLEEDDEPSYRSKEARISHYVGSTATNHTDSRVSVGISSSHDAPAPMAEKLPTHVKEKPSVFVAGSLAVDLSCDFAPRSPSSSKTPQQHTSNPATITQTLGGVGHNVARAAHLMGADVRLCSAVGDDLSGQAAVQALTSAGMAKTGIKVLEDGSRTAQYVAVNDGNKDLVMAMADFSLLSPPSTCTSKNNVLSDTFDTFWMPQLQAFQPTHLAIDANWSGTQLGQWIRTGKSIGAHITFEPVSNVKSTTLFQLPTPHTLGIYPNSSINLATPNAHELTAMYTAARDSGAFEREDWWTVIDALGIPSSGARVQLALLTTSSLVDQGIPQQSIQLLPFIPCLCTKLGPQGVLLTQLLPAGDPRLTSGDYAPYILSRCSNDTEADLGVGGVYMRLFPSVEAIRAEDVASVNGVGDTFAGTLLAGLARRGRDAKVEDLIDLAQRAAVLTLKSRESVAPGLGTLRLLL